MINYWRRESEKQIKLRISICFARILFAKISNSVVPIPFSYFLLRCLWKRRQVLLELQWFHEQWDICFIKPLHRCHPLPAINQVRTKVNAPQGMCHPTDVPPPWFATPLGAAPLMCHPPLTCHLLGGPAHSPAGVGHQTVCVCEWVCVPATSKSLSGWDSQDFQLGETPLVTICDTLPVAATPRVPPQCGTAPKSGTKIAIWFCQVEEGLGPKVSSWEIKCMFLKPRVGLSIFPILQWSFWWKFHFKINSDRPANSAWHASPASCGMNGPTGETVPKRRSSPTPGEVGLW